MRFTPTSRPVEKPVMFSVLVSHKVNDLLEKTCRDLRLKKADLVRQMIIHCQKEMKK